MHIFRSPEKLAEYLARKRTAGGDIGYVPTMGALHDGHLALLAEAKVQCDLVLCSIFVKPTQFTDPADFAQYPVDLKTDLRTLIEAGCSVLYAPDARAVYPEGMDQLESYAFGDLETRAEGAHRPGHFQGVGQVLSRFVRLIQPDKMFMGQKDYQQVRITGRLLELLEMPVELVMVPTHREADGLAQSSRNVRLSAAARQTAPLLHATLAEIVSRRFEAPLDRLLAEGTAKLQDAGFTVEYLQLADATDLKPAAAFGPMPQVLLIAAWLDGVRLIDNILLKKDG